MTVTTGQSSIITRRLVDSILQLGRNQAKKRIINEMKIRAVSDTRFLARMMRINFYIFMSFFLAFVFILLLSDFNMFDVLYDLSLIHI